MKHKIAVQLFTLRKECKRDFPGVLRELSKMGYAGVQVGGLFGYDPLEIAAVLRETGLRVAGLHAGYEQIAGEPDRLAGQARLFQTNDIICPYIQPPLRTEQGYRDIKRALNESAKRLKAEGMRIGYHNHDFEFAVEVDGMPAIEYMLDPSPDNAILAEIDVYWVRKAGLDPLSFIGKYANRMPIIHFKDMTNDERQDYAEIGTGCIDFVPLLRWGETNGIEWYVVEQDECPRDPMDCVQTSLNHLHAMMEKMAAG